MSHRTQLLRTVGLLAMAASLSGCALGLGKSLHEFSMMESLAESKGKSRPIEADSDQTVIILATDTDFADLAYNRLLLKCPTGQITNINAQYSTDLGFFAYKNKMKLRGVCTE